MDRSQRIQLANRQDRDRATLERIGVSAAQRIGLTARIRAMHLWRATHDPATVARSFHDLLLGNERIREPGMVSILAKGMLAAHLRGRYRTQLNTRPAEDRILQAACLGDRVGYALLLSSARPAFRPLLLSNSAYQDALDFVQTRIDAKPGQIKDLEAKYNTEAIRMLQGVAKSTENKILDALGTAIETGASVNKGVTMLRDAFDRAGVLPGNNWQLQTIYRTEVQKAYAAGRWNSLQESKDIIKSLEYAAIEDDRTTELCLKLDGTVRPIDDPFWKKFTPPNHWNCRSSVLEVFDYQKIRNTRAPDLSGVQRFPDFEVNFGEIFADLLKVAA